MDCVYQERKPRTKGPNQKLRALQDKMNELQSKIESRGGSADELSDENGESGDDEDEFTLAPTEDSISPTRQPEDFTRAASILSRTTALGVLPQAGVPSQMASSSTDGQTTDWLFSVFRDEVGPLTMLFPQGSLPYGPLAFRQAAASLAGRYLGGQMEQHARDLYVAARSSIQPMLTRKVPPTLEGCNIVVMLAMYLCFSHDVVEMSEGTELLSMLSGFVRDLGLTDELLVFKSRLISNSQPASEFATPDLKRKLLW